MDWLPIESYAVRSMIILVCGMFIFIICVFSTIRLFDSSQKASGRPIIVLAVMIVGLIIMIVFFIFSFYFIPTVKAWFSHISYRYFALFDQVEDASASISEALNSDQQNPLYWKESGDLCMSKKDYEKSIYYYNRALELRHDSDIILFARGCAYQENNDLTKARKDLTTVVEHCPDNAEYNYKLARVYYSYGLKSKNDSEDYYKHALHYFTEAISINPKNKDYYYWRANTYLWIGTNENYLHAIDDFTTAIGFHIDNDEYYYWRGKAYMFLNEYSNINNAICDFTEAIEINRDTADYYWWRGKAYDQLKQYQKAINNYDIAIRKNADNAEYYYSKTLVYNKQKDQENERENILKAIEYDEENPTYHNYLGSLYYNEGDYENAITEFQRSTVEASNTAGYYFNLGDAYYMNKQYRKAIDAYSNAIKLDNTKSLYLLRRSLCYFQIDDIKNMKDDMIATMNAQEHGSEIYVD